MTETRERDAGGRWPTADRSLLATVLGVSPATAVGLAAALTGLGVFADLARIGSLGAVFTICYVTGCVLAVAWVRRNALFAPLVQPPLLVAVAVPVVVLLAGFPKPGAGVAERLLVIGAPLVNAFPTMAWTTGAVLALGVIRVAVQTRPEAAAERPRTEPAAASRPKASAARSTRPRSSVVGSRRPGPRSPGAGSGGTRSGESASGGAKSSGVA